MAGHGGVLRDARRRRPRGRGVAAGLLASLLFSQTLTGVLFDVAPFDAATLAGVSLLLLAMAAAAAWFPGAAREPGGPAGRAAHGVGVICGGRVPAAPPRPDRRHRADGRAGRLSQAARRLAG